MTNAPGAKTRYSVVLLATAVASVSRRVRFPGRERLLRWSFPPDRFRGMRGPHEFTVSYDRSMKFRCDLGSYLEWGVFFKGYYVPDLSLAIKKLVKPGMCAVDIGANVGAYTLLIAKGVGRGGKVVSFEPNPEVFRRLEHNIALNGLQDRVRLWSLALSNRRGEAVLYVPREDFANRAISSLRKYADILTETTRVEVRTLDGVFRDLSLDRLDFLKIDTDGSDALIIQGGMETIVRYRPVIIFEANYLAHSDAGISIESVRQALKSSDYSFCTVGVFGRLVPCPMHRPLPDSDIVCIPEKAS